MLWIIAKVIAIVEFKVLVKLTLLWIFFDDGSFVRYSLFINETYYLETNKKILLLSNNKKVVVEVIVKVIVKVIEKVKLKVIVEVIVLFLW